MMSNGLLTLDQPHISSVSLGLKSKSSGESGSLTSAMMNGNASGSDVGLPLRSVSMGHAEVVKMNLMTIRRVDSEVVGIVSTVPRVMLYEYEEGTNTWERTSVEGTLFLYSREGSPSHGFMILNRLSSENMHQLIHVGMEFRVQSPFVLFKKDSGNIFGLCFSEEPLCHEIGQLLTSLSVGVSNGYSSDPQSLTAHMRSSSAPQFQQQRNRPRSGEQQKGDIMELLESAGRSYLNQTFSDDTSSQDSSPSEPISFTVVPPEYDLQQHKEVTRKLRTATDRRTSEPPSKSKERRSKQNPPEREKRGQGTQRASSPREIRPSKSQQQQSMSVSPKQSRHRPVSPKKSRQPNINGTTGHRGHLQHATSFDSKSHPRDSGGKSAPSKGQNSSLPGSRSTSPFSSISNQQRTTPAAVRTATDDPAGVGGMAKKPSFPSKIARKLFGGGEDPSEYGSESYTRTEPGSVGASTSSSLSTTLASLFSQATLMPTQSNTVTSTEASSSPMSLKAISLSEIEKQMQEEAPSPDPIVNPLRVFSSPPAVYTHPTTITTAPMPVNQSLPLSSSQEKLQVLLQPSAFSATVGTTSAVQLQTVSSDGFSNSAPTQSLETQITVDLNPPVPHSSHRSVREATKPNSVAITQSVPTTSNPVAISIEPPSPVVTRNLPTSVSSEVVKSLFVAPAHLCSPQSFPPIPPVMHSPGMRAAPVAAQSGHEHPRSEEHPLAQRSLQHVAQASHSPLLDSSLPELGQLRHRTVSEPAFAALGVFGLPETAILQTQQPPPPPDAGATPPPSSQALSALMSPMQFSSRQQQLERSAETEGLNREQFKQALLHLIQHDEDFVATIHKAYQQTLTQNQH